MIEKSASKTLMTASFTKGQVFTVCALHLASNDTCVCLLETLKPDALQALLRH